VICLCADEWRNHYLVAFLILAVASKLKVYMMQYGCCQFPFDF